MNTTNFIRIILLMLVFCSDTAYSKLKVVHGNNIKKQNTIVKKIDSSKVENVQLLDNNVQNQTIENQNMQQSEISNAINNNNKIQQSKTLIRYDAEQLQSTGKKIIKKVNAITYFTFGREGQPVIEIYISPSCLHCAQFILEDLEKFLTIHRDNCFIKVMLIPVTAKDFFIMKIIQAEARDSNGYYIIFSNYMKRAIATIDSIIPTKEQKDLYRGSNTDPDMIKYQVIASEFKFSDEKIINAIPNMEEDYELAVMEYYKNTVKEIFEKLQLDATKNSELEVPLIICNNKICNNLNDAMKECNLLRKMTPN